MTGIKWTWAVHVVTDYPMLQEHLAIMQATPVVLRNGSNLNKTEHFTLKSVVGICICILLTTRIIITNNYDVSFITEIQTS